MADPRLAKLFDRYRTQGDLTALGEVFDRVSPDLLRVARHLKSRGVEPEDLVQATFLTAIERSAAFDSERPLLPWLFGILVNQARRSRRVSSRSAGEAQEDTLVARPDREHDAESTEVETAVARALADLPENYREVLVRHLAEGQEPHEIARELGRPQGTVRAQIHRGIRLMRRLLPSGFALGSMGWAPDAALSAVRERVLADGARALGRGPEVVRALEARRAARITRRRITTIGAAGILGLCAWYAWPTDRAAATHESKLVESATPHERERTPALSDSAPLARREAVEMRVAGPATAVEALGSLVVLVHDAESDAPVVGARVSMIPWGTTRWFEDIRETRTDAEGRAGFRNIHPGRVGVHVDGGAQSRADVIGDQETVHRVVRERGVALVAEVADVAGRPIPGAVVDLFAKRDEPAFATSAPADAAGLIRIEGVPQEVFVAARAEGFATSPLVWSSALSSTPSSGSRLAFRLPSGGLVLEGSVVDEAGAPIVGAHVLVTTTRAAPCAVWRADGSPAFEAAPASTTSDPIGRFALGGLAAGELEITVEAPGRAPHVATSTPEENDFPFTIVRLGRVGSLEGRVTFSDDTPAGGALVDVRVGRRTLLSTRCDADGSFQLADTPVGRVTVRARAGGLGPATESELLLESGRAFEWKPVVERVATIEGQAFGEDGRVLQTWLVLATPEDPPSDAESRLARWANRSVPAALDDLAVQCWIPLSTRFVLPCRGTGPHRIEVRARNAWRDPPQTYATGILPGSHDVALRVNKNRGALRGRFVDPQGRPAMPTRVVAISTGTTGEIPGRIDAATGRFDIEVLPDAYTLLAWTRESALHAFDVGALDRPAALDVGDLVIHRSGSVRFDTAGQEPSRIELRASNGLLFEVVRAGEHAWTAGNLQPGSYVLRVTWQDGSAWDRPVTVESGVVASVSAAEK